MGLLQTLGQGQGYLKAGFLGFPKSGKTYTAALLAAEVSRLYAPGKPIAFFDTEGGSEYVADLVSELTGAPPVGVKSKSFDQLLEVAKECESEGIEVLLVDSVTHIWRNLCESYLANQNEIHRRKGWSPRTELAFQDWSRIKGRWADWTDVYLNASLHIIICGRAGFEYDFEENDRGKKELVKTGVKMKTETEFGFEPSLLIEMARESTRSGKEVRTNRVATIIGDRFGQIDGKHFEFGTDGDATDHLTRVATAFGPHLERLKPGVHTPIANRTSDLGLDEDGNDDWAREKKSRTILCEEIQGLLVKYHPKQTTDDKSRKLELIEQVFGTRSWTRVESTPSADLRLGLEKLRGILEPGEETERDADADLQAALECEGERE